GGNPRTPRIRAPQPERVHPPRRPARRESIATGPRKSRGSAWALCVWRYSTCPPSLPILGLFPSDQLSAPPRRCSPMSDPRLPILAELEKKVLWLSSWTIHNANHLRDNDDGLKVGGHQASSASLATILTALYFAVLKPEDRVAVKPHAGPAFHAIQYLLDRQ